MHHHSLAVELFNVSVRLAMDGRTVHSEKKHNVWGLSLLDLQWQLTFLPKMLLLHFRIVLSGIYTASTPCYDDKYSPASFVNVISYMEDLKGIIGTVFTTLWLLQYDYQSLVECVLQFFFKEATVWSSITSTVFSLSIILLYRTKRCYSNFLEDFTDE